MFTKSELGARSRGPDRCACQNRRWCLFSPRRTYDGYCQCRGDSWIAPTVLTKA